MEGGGGQNLYASELVTSWQRFSRKISAAYSVKTV